MKKSNFFLIFLLFVGFRAGAQYFSTGQDPFSQKWHEVKSPHFRLLLPDSLVISAGNYIRILEESLGLINQDLRTRHKRIPVVLHNQSVISNAFVSWAPARMEFYMHPPRSSYAEPWFRQLALHEGRHFLQLSSLNQGMSRPLGWLFGEQYIGLLTGLYLPRWFLEGDAVYAETIFGKAGRGSQPSFSMELRCQVLERGIYSYDKAVFGSYRDYIPNHYILGYHLVAAGAERHGSTFWPSVLRKIARNPYMVMPFSAGIHTHSKMGKARFYRSVLEELKQKWQAELVTGGTRRTSWESYRFPVFVGNDSLVAVRSGMNDPDALVLITGNQIKQIRITGSLNEDPIRYANGMIYWSEQRDDLRWQNRSRSEIQTYNLATGRQSTLTRATRYFSPALSPDGKKLVVVEAGEQGIPKLAILDATDGSLKERISIPGISNITFPVFEPDGNHILCVITGEEGNAIARIEPDGNYNLLIPFTRADISDLCPVKNTILFISNFEGQDQIYSRDSQKAVVNRISSELYGVGSLQLAADSGKILFSGYTANGWKIRTLHMDTVKKTEINFNKLIINEMPVLNFNLKRKNQSLNTQIIPAYTLKPYRNFESLFQFHSWAPVYIDATNEEANAGVSVMSQNLLSSSFLTAGYIYNAAEGSGKYKLSYSYEGFYPHFGISWEQGNRKAERVYNGKKISYSWEEQNIKTTVALPLNISRHAWSGAVVPFIRNTFFRAGEFTDSLVPAFRGYYNTLDYGLTFYRYQRSSVKSLFPTTGFWLGAHYRHTPFEGVSLGNIAGIQGYVYIPGILKHHGLRVGAGFQERETGPVYTFSDVISLPSGFEGFSGTRFRSVSALYRFPLIYPDFSIPAVLYVKRITGGLFYDYAISSVKSEESVYEARGTEIRMQFHLFRFYAPIELGVRTRFTPGKNSPDWQITYGFSFGQAAGSKAWSRLHRDMHNF